MAECRSVRQKRIRLVSTPTEEIEKASRASTTTPSEQEKKEEEDDCEFPVSLKRPRIDSPTPGESTRSSSSDKWERIIRFMAEMDLPDDEDAADETKLPRDDFTTSPPKLLPGGTHPTESKEEEMSKPHAIRTVIEKKQVLDNYSEWLALIIRTDGSIEWVSTIPISEVQTSIDHTVVCEYERVPSDLIYELCDTVSGVTDSETKPKKHKKKIIKPVKRPSVLPLMALSPKPSWWCRDSNPMAASVLMMLGFYRRSLVDSLCRSMIAHGEGNDSFLDRIMVSQPMSLHSVEGTVMITRKWSTSDFTQMVNNSTVSNDRLDTSHLSPARKKHVCFTRAFVSTMTRFCDVIRPCISDWTNHEAMDVTYRRLVRMRARFTDLFGYSAKAFIPGAVRRVDGGRRPLRLQGRRQPLQQKRYIHVV